MSLKTIVNTAFLGATLSDNVLHVIAKTQGSSFSPEGAPPGQVVEQVKPKSFLERAPSKQPTGCCQCRFLNACAEFMCGAKTTPTNIARSKVHASDDCLPAGPSGVIGSSSEILPQPKLTVECTAASDTISIRSGVQSLFHSMESMMEEFVEQYDDKEVSKKLGTEEDRISKEEEDLLDKVKEYSKNIKRRLPRPATIQETVGQSSGDSVRGPVGSSGEPPSSDDYARSDREIEAIIEQKQKIQQDQGVLRALKIVWSKVARRSGSSETPSESREDRLSRRREEKDKLRQSHKDLFQSLSDVEEYVPATGSGCSSTASRKEQLNELDSQLKEDDDFFECMESIADETPEAARQSESPRCAAAASSSDDLPSNTPSIAEASHACPPASSSARFMETALTPVGEQSTGAIECQASSARVDKDAFEIAYGKARNKVS